MKLFESELLDQDQNQTTVVVQPEPRYQPTTASLPSDTNERGHTWIRTIGMILIGLVLVVTIVLLARWAYHRTHHNISNSPGKVSNNAAKLSGAADNLAANSGSSPPSSSTSAPSSSRPSSSSNGSATPNSSNITNTGPGNVVGLFVGTSLAVAGLHFVVSLRRFNRT